MSLQQFQSDMRVLLADLERMFEVPVRPFQLGWEIEQMLIRRLRRERSVGLGTECGIDWFTDGRPGHELLIGIHFYRWELDGRVIRVANVSLPYQLRFPDFWVVPVADYRELYRSVRKLLRRSHSMNVEPYMCQEDRERLWQNTIGFLRRDNSELRRFNIPQKRGVLLTGEPGNGKTMACRWLAVQCQRYGLDWESVTMDRYEQARSDNGLHDLFQPTHPGIIAFDDFDSALHDRKTAHDTRDQSTFLTEMDGLSPRTGVVYIFTTNLKVEDLDPALRRPGRIDQVIDFPKPFKEIRQRFIQERWPAEIVSQIDINSVIHKTDELSFAELEELRKLLVMRYLDTGNAEWKWARDVFEGRCDGKSNRRRIGFVQGKGGDQVQSSSQIAATIT